jgi:glyoxylase-like metal-dependent hydrolase (beta-lactamase superfamily II)
MNFGNFSIELLETGDFALDGGAMFGVVPRNLWEKAYHAPDDQNRIPMKARCLLIRGHIGGKDRVVLVDAGNGEKFPPKIAQLYKIDNTQFRLETSLARFGVKPEDVTDVILTHLHFDHAGGITTLDAMGKPYPTFRNARHYVQRDHLRWAQYPTEKDRASFFRENFDPIVASGQMEILDGDGSLWADDGISITLHNVHGHTKALQTVMIELGSGNEKERIYFPADLLPTSAHVSVPYVMAYDNFPLTTIEEKKALLPRLYEEKWLVVFEHDGFIQASRIVAAERGFMRGEGVVITEW